MNNIESLPFKQEQLSDNSFVRTFNQNVNNEELKWHRDYKDRTVFVLNENNWLIQFDNQLPEPLQEMFFIKKGIYHRLIKGTTDLKIKIIET